MKTLLLLLFGLSAASLLTAQTSLQGKVTDAESGEPIIFGSVILEKEGVYIAGVQTDFDGNYSISKLDPGTYDVECTYVGYLSVTVEGVVVKAGTANRLDIQMTASVALDEVEVIAYKVPLIERDNTTTGSVISADRINRLPQRKIGKSKGKKSKKGDQGASVKGSRSDASTYYIDGVQVSGNLIPQTEVGSTNQMKTNPGWEEYRYFEENSFLDPRQEPLSTFSIDVDRAAYSNVRRYLEQGQLPPPDAVRIEEMINYFEYDYPTPAAGEPFAVQTELASCPWAPERQLLRISLQGARIDLSSAAPNNLVFLLDVSGSMQAYNKLELVKPAMRLLVDQLRPQDRVAIVVYAGAAGLVLESTPGSDRQKILEAIDRLQAGGSTAGAAGIKLAYQVAKEHFIEEGNNRVILATDGDFNVGVASESELTRLIEAKRDDGIFLTALGFGMGNYKDNKLEILADVGNGNYAYIDNLQEARKMFVHEITGTLYTIAKDVKIQVEFNPARVGAYRLIGYENRLLAAEDFNDDTKDAGELGAGHRVTALYELVSAGAETTLVRNVDPLRYQAVPTSTAAANSEEWGLVKLRYKEPRGRKSRLLEQPIVHTGQDIVSATGDLRHAASVAAFGMILRRSEYVGDYSLRQVSELAQSALGRDEYGYRAEFIRLVNSAEALEPLAENSK